MTEWQKQRSERKARLEAGSRFATGKLAFRGLGTLGPLLRHFGRRQSFEIRQLRHLQARNDGFQKLPFWNDALSHRFVSPNRRPAMALRLAGRIAGLSIRSDRT
jgi:hypothetical protein